MKFYIAANHEVTDLKTGEVIAKPNKCVYGAFKQAINHAWTTYFPYKKETNAIYLPKQPVEIYYHNSLWLDIKHIKKQKDYKNEPIYLKKVTHKPSFEQNEQLSLF